jgi:hypothetical protein
MSRSNVVGLLAVGLAGGGLALYHACRPGALPPVETHPAEAEQPPAAAPPPAAQAAPAPGSVRGFTFPHDGAGPLLATALAFEPAPGPSDPPAGPLRRAGLTAVELPEPPLPPVNARPPEILWRSTAQYSPHPPAEGLFADARPLGPGLPAPPLPAGAPPRVASADASSPPPLPLTTRPSPDRASLDDPTAEFSAQRATAATPPVRTAPAPFVRVNLPDPFEHAATVRPRTPPAEDPATDMPTTLGPRP